MKKLYYTIGEVSELTGVEPHVIRYWETVFNELKPLKKSGKRSYTEKNIETILELKVLIKDLKYSTAGAKKALREKQDGNANDKHIEPIPVDVIKDLTEARLLLKKIHDLL